MLLTVSVLHRFFSLQFGLTLKFGEPELLPRMRETSERLRRRMYVDLTREGQVVQ
jgi:hypothetical protein